MSSKNSYKKEVKNKRRRSISNRTMQNNRKKSYINALTECLQNCTDTTYAEIGNQIIENLEKLDIDDPKWKAIKDDPLEREKRVSRLALGNKPTAHEKLALSMWKFNDAKRWPELYFPNYHGTYSFILNIYNNELNEVNKLFNSQKISPETVKQFSKDNIRKGIDAAKIAPYELMVRLLGLLYLKTADEVRIGKSKNKRNLKKLASSWIESTITEDSPFIKELTIQLRHTLDLNRSKQKELKQVVLRALISIL